MWFGIKGWTINKTSINPNWKNVMKTSKTNIENFAIDAMTQEEMFHLRGGGVDEPIDMVIPPR